MLSLSLQYPPLPLRRSNNVLLKNYSKFFLYNVIIIFLGKNLKKEKSFNIHIDKLSLANEDYFYHIAGTAYSLI